MEYLAYSYIAHPTTAQVGAFVRSLGATGIALSHLGKRDPPGRFVGSLDDAVPVICSGTDATNWTFARDARRRLELSFGLRQGPRWPHSTVSASCPDRGTVATVCRCAEEEFKLFLAILGRGDAGKHQPWEMVYVSPECPAELLNRVRAT